jgi:hypothetical protein
MMQSLQRHSKVNFIGLYSILVVFLSSSVHASVLIFVKDWVTIADFEFFNDLLFDLASVLSIICRVNDVL